MQNAKIKLIKKSEVDAVMPAFANIIRVRSGVVILDLKQQPKIDTTLNLVRELLRKCQIQCIAFLYFAHFQRRR